MSRRLRGLVLGVPVRTAGQNGQAIIVKCGFSALCGHELILLPTHSSARLGWGCAMRKFLGIACSMILALAVTDAGTGKAPVEGITVAQYLGKGKAPIGKGKGKAPPPPVVTKG